MFLVEQPRTGVTVLVFTLQDPRTDGFAGTVVEGAALDYDMAHVHSWPDGTDCPDAVTGQNPANNKHYKVFKYSRDREAAGFQPVKGIVTVFRRWSDFTRLLDQ